MFWKDFSSAVRSYSQALKLFNELGLWKYVFVPILIGLLLGAVVIFLAYISARKIGEWVADIWPWDFLSGFIEGLGGVLGGILVILIGLMVFKHAVMALAAPFMTPVSEKIEMHLTGRKLNPTDSMTEYIAAIVRATRINVRNLVLEILTTIPLLILGLIPVVNIVSTVLIFYIQSYYAGFGNMDYTLERYRNYSGSVKFVRKHKGVAAGNGFIFILLLFIPVIGICIALPLSTAAATIDTIKKLDEKPSQ
ncbi:MAG: EI24 domain-containing protein [Crocinitomicaceae bacterium]|nr:EI24 domain-containing protein [Crocinitomicaceae bacterium]